MDYYNNSHPQEVYLRGSLSISRNNVNDLIGNEIKQITSETESIINIISNTESSNLQLCLGNLRKMQANVTHIIPQYIDNENILLELLSLKDRIDDTLLIHSNISEEASNRMLRESLGVLINDLTRNDKNEENEIDNNSINKLELCPVCYEDKYLEILPCEHSYCKMCIQQHLQVCLTEGKVLNLNCLNINCDFLFTESILEDYLTEKQFLRYQELLLVANIRADPNKKCCTQPDCNGIVNRNQNLDYQGDWNPHPFSKCDSCNFSFCFECLRDYHGNKTCNEYEKELRLKKLLSDDDMSNWEDGNTKPCPRCKVLIEKSEGCNHVRCTSCNVNFCWLCGKQGATEGHFSVPGPCFGQLFADESGAADTAMNVVLSAIFLPITAPVFGITSAVEKIQVQSKKMDRRKTGVDYKIIITGATDEERTKFFSTYCSEDYSIEDNLKIYKCTATTHFVQCRLTLIDISASDIQSSDKYHKFLEDTDGYIILFKPLTMDNVNSTLLLYDDIISMVNKSGVPGSLFSIDTKKKEVKKSILKNTAKKHDLLYRKISLNKRWGISRGVNSLLKIMLKRYAPTIDPVIED